MKMKYIVIIAVLLGLLVPALGQPDPYYMLTGRQMIGSLGGGVGYGPWIGDNTTVYFGIDKDASIYYQNNASAAWHVNKICINGANVTIQKNLTVTGTATIGGTAVSSGLIADNIVMTSNKYFKPQAGTGYMNLGLMTGKFLGVAGETDLNTTKLTALTVNTSATMGANAYLTSVAGTGYVNLGRMTGKLIGPTGETDLNTTKMSVITVNTTGTFTGVQTFTAAPVFNAGFTIPSGQAMDTTTADKLKEAGVIVPTEIPVKYAFDKNTTYNRSFECLDGAWQVDEIDVSYSAAGSSGLKMYLGKATGTQVPQVSGGATKGVSLTVSSIAMDSTINTVITPSLNATTSNLQFANHDRLFVDFCKGGVGSIVGQCTVWMHRI